MVWLAQEGYTVSVLDGRPARGYHFGMNYLRAYRERAGLSQTQLAEAAKPKTSQPQIVRLEGSKRKLTMEWVQRLAPALGVNPEDLMFRPPVEPDLPADTTGAISTEGRIGIPEGDIPQVDAVLGLGLTGEARAVTFQIDRGEMVTGVPVRDTWRIPPTVIQRRVRANIDNLYLVECEGNSMAPLIKSGDVVLVDQSRRNPRMPGVFALWEGDGLTLKQIEIIEGSEPMKYRLIPANKDYTSYEVAADAVNIIGRYVARFTVD